MIFTGILVLFSAIWIVSILHEIGHLPRRIELKRGFFIMPDMEAINSRSRIGGLVMNAVIFLGVWFYKPESILLQAMGIVAWIHFVTYAIIGALVPEHKGAHSMDDVPNSQWYIWVPIGLATFFLLKGFYIPLFGSLF